MSLASPAGSDAGSGGSAPGYARHRPEQTLLYRLVEEHYPAFKAHLAAQGAALPRHVAREFDDFLACGRHNGALGARRGAERVVRSARWGARRSGESP